MNEKTVPVGGLIWITGYSGAGKTTVARIVSEELKDKELPVLFLDGDDLRSILGEKFGHDLEDRKKLANVYSRLCKRICDNGITVVIATVAMFESVRTENRISNLNYLEVYLDVPLDVRVNRDPKGIYLAATKKGNLSSISAGFEEPQNPDIVINNYEEITPHIAALEIVERYTKNSQIIKAPSPLIPAAYIDRTKYWDSYYAKRGAPIPPSSFAIFCNENFFGDHCHVLEFGCGNGRDSFYFSKKHHVTAIDQSIVAINANKQRVSDEGILSVDFIDGRFGEKIVGMPQSVDVVYGRFVLHAMSLEDETQALNYAYKTLKPGGKIFLEFRTDKDELMNKGITVGLNERVTDHYRRFINLDEFLDRLSRIGFTQEYCVEKNGLAKHVDDDPTVARVIATKAI